MPETDAVDRVLDPAEFRLVDGSVAAAPVRAVSPRSQAMFDFMCKDLCRTVFPGDECPGGVGIPLGPCVPEIAVVGPAGATVARELGKVDLWAPTSAPHRIRRPRAAVGGDGNGRCPTCDDGSVHCHHYVTIGRADVTVISTAKTASIPTSGGPTGQFGAGPFTLGRPQMIHHGQRESQLDETSTEVQRHQ